MKILSIVTMDAASMQPPSPEEMERMGALIEEMRRKGALIDTGGAMPGMFEMTIARKGGSYKITDGPFTEAKEIVGGFALLEVAGRDEAIAFTRQFLDLCGDATCHLHEVSASP
ncbi:MAG: YciI family protein [Vulcanimicrobiaceae bacterium]